MKKEDVASLIIYFIMIAVAIIVGLSVVSPIIEKFQPSNMSPFVLVILILVFGLLLNIILLEVFHVIGAKIGGYKVTMFNILGFCFEKRAGKWVFKFREFDGLTGETKIAPNKEKLNLKPYVWLPIFGYAFEIASCIVVYSMINQNGGGKVGWLAIASILLLIISSMIALYNLVPFKLDSMTDGYRMVLLAKKVNTDAYNELLRVEELEREGKEVDSIKVFEEITEFTAEINLISVYHHLNKHEYEEAENLINLIINNKEKVDPKTYNRLIAQKLFIQIMSKEKEEAQKTYDDLATTEIRRFIANDLSMESIRSYVLISGILEGSQGEVEFAKSRIEKAKKNTLPSRVDIENKMFNEALDKVYQVHPKWVKENTAE